MACASFTANAGTYFSNIDDCILFYADDLNGKTKVTEDNWDIFNRRYAINLKLVKEVYYYGGTILSLDGNQVHLSDVKEQMADIMEEWQSCIN